MRVIVDKDEEWPVYSVHESMVHYAVEMDDDLFEEYERVENQRKIVQDKLEKFYNDQWRK